MKPELLLEPIAPSDPANGTASAKEIRLSIVLVCQDAATQEWACETCEQTARLACKGAVHSQCWNIGDLARPEALASAVSAAREADVIVVSMQAAKVLPLALFAWLEGWFPHRTRAGGTLAVVMGAAERPDVHSNYIEECLRTVARLSGLGFYWEERQLPKEPTRLFPERMQSHARATTWAPLINLVA